MSDFLPDEIVVEILQRLPTQSLIKFRSVSKSWNSLITSPTFINSHLTHSLTSNNNNKNKNSPLSIVRHCVPTTHTRTEHYKLCHDTEEAFDEYKEIEFPIKSRRLHYFYTIGSAKGLFCFYEQDRYFLWNPSIRKSISIPKPIVKCSWHSLGFGFDPRTNDYKVVRIVSKDEPTTHIEVYSLNAGSWKIPSGASDSYPLGVTIGYTGRFAAFLEGAVHFAASMRNSNVPLILSFDMCDEVFQTMLLPNILVDARNQITTSVFGGFLSLLCYDEAAANKSCSVWIMKEYGVVDSFYKQFKVDLSGGITRVLGIRNNGHILLEAKAPSEWMLSSYDPSSQQIKNLGIYGTSYHFHVDTYEENLILLNKTNHAVSRRGVNRKRKDRLTLDQSTHARIKALSTDIQRLIHEIDLQFEVMKGKIEAAHEDMARMGPQQRAEVAKLWAFFLKFQPKDASGNEQTNSMRLTATSQGSVVNDCDEAAKLSHSGLLGRGVGVKGKDLNGCTSSVQSKDYMMDEDLEAHLIKMKAQSVEMLKQLSQRKDQILQTIDIPTVQPSNAQSCSREII